MYIKVLSSFLLYLIPIFKLILLSKYSKLFSVNKLLYAVTETKSLSLIVSIDFAFILYNIFSKISLHLYICKFFVYSPTIQNEISTLSEYLFNNLSNLL